MEALRGAWRRRAQKKPAPRAAIIVRRRRPAVRARERRSQSVGLGREPKAAILDQDWKAAALIQPELKVFQSYRAGCVALHANLNLTAREWRRLPTLWAGGSNAEARQGRGVIQERPRRRWGLGGADGRL
jgi:hypothetical protein